MLCMIALPYFFKSRGRWGFLLKPQKAPFCTPSHFRLISVVPSPKGQFSKLQGWLLVKLFLQSKNKFIKSVRKSVRVFTQSEQYLLREGFVPPQKGVFLWEERIYPKKKLSALDSGVTFMDLFNSTSERDASHLCLISIEPKEGCTNHVWY